MTLWNRATTTDNVWNLQSVQRPWSGDISAYDHIRKYLTDPDRQRTRNAETLPDEKPAVAGEVRWSSGALEGNFGRGDVPHGLARRVLRALSAVVANCTTANVQKLYALLIADSVPSFVDDLLPLIIKQHALDADRLKALAIWLAKHAPDRAAVKVAIAILGVVTPFDQRDLIITLGAHDEFTLYAAVALRNGTRGNCERELMQMAEHVHGWGRVAIVDRLALTTSATTKAWLLREGYKVMCYYMTAYTCATAGDLRRALADEHVDDALLIGAGVILSTLVDGNPCRDIEDYDDGIFVVERYLQHVVVLPKQIDFLVTIESLQAFLRRKTERPRPRAELGWTPDRCASIAATMARVTADPAWRPIVAAALASSDNKVFGAATAAARAIGDDPWPHQFARLVGGDRDQWWHVMQTKDAARVEQVVAFAIQSLPLAQIATRDTFPLRNRSLSAGYEDLRHVLQELTRFSGIGWALLHAGIRSADSENRWWALNSLSQWPRTIWPDDARRTLLEAQRLEPKKELRRRMKRVLAGKALDVD